MTAFMWLWNSLPGTSNVAETVDRIMEICSLNPGIIAGEGDQEYPEIYDTELQLGEDVPYYYQEIVFRQRFGCRHTKFVWPGSFPGEVDEGMVHNGNNFVVCDDQTYSEVIEQCLTSAAKRNPEMGFLKIP